jgi:hypothetical protein
LLEMQWINSTLLLDVNVFDFCRLYGSAEMLSRVRWGSGCATAIDRHPLLVC